MRVTTKILRAIGVTPKISGVSAGFCTVVDVNMKCAKKGFMVEVFFADDLVLTLMSKSMKGLRKKF